ncbi:MAG TPA: hypothetical protein DCE39_13925 [Planctomycetaceae bacterium]|nr:hypothetical protein [Planctomycetaceae bacterium]
MVIWASLEHSAESQVDFAVPEECAFPCRQRAPLSFLDQIDASRVSLGSRVVLVGQMQIQAPSMPDRVRSRFQVIGKCRVDPDSGFGKMPWSDAEPGALVVSVGLPWGDGDGLQLRDQLPGLLGVSQSPGRRTVDRDDVQVAQLSPAADLDAELPLGHADLGPVDTYELASLCLGRQLQRDTVERHGCFGRIGGVAGGQGYIVSSIGEIVVEPCAAIVEHKRVQPSVLCNSSVTCSAFFLWRTGHQPKSAFLRVQVPGADPNILLGRCNRLAAKVVVKRLVRLEVFGSIGCRRRCRQDHKQAGRPLTCPEPKLCRWAFERPMSVRPRTRSGGIFTRAGRLTGERLCHAEDSIGVETENPRFCSGAMSFQWTVGVPCVSLYPGVLTKNTVMDIVAPLRRGPAVRLAIGFRSSERFIGCRWQWASGRFSPIGGLQLFSESPKEKHMSLVGQPAPEWAAAAYHNGEQKELSSEDIKGKWCVLYFYPLDFTFI